MYYYRLAIAYKGTQYFGWQSQSVDTLHEAKPTVEGTILNSLRKMVNHQSCTISVASRTDGGVHAQGQVAKIILPIAISPHHLLLGLNSLLPADIRILNCSPSTKNYQPNKSSVSKEYHYFFTTSPIANATLNDIALHVPINGPPHAAIERMRLACRLFVGQHDFYNFSSREKNRSSSVREVFYCDIHKANFHPIAEDVYYLKVIGDGFLKYMIRYLMGALLEVLAEKITPHDIALYLRQHQANKLSAKVKAKGLHLIAIEERSDCHDADN